MGRKVTVTVIDDLTGQALEEHVTVRWSVDGDSYEFDTAPKSAVEFMDLLARYRAASRSTPDRADPPRTPLARARLTPAQSAVVRQWAFANGYILGTRGRIPSGVLESYRNAA